KPLLGPAQRRRRQVLHEVLPERPLLRDVFEDFLVKDLPAELVGDAPADGAAARAGLAADGDGQPGGDAGRRRRRRAVAPEAVARRLAGLRGGGQFIAALGVRFHSSPWSKVSLLAA